MDVSLDDYIGSRPNDVNFRVQISNPNVGRGRGNRGRMRGKFNQQGFKRFQKNPQASLMQVNVTNTTGFDARDKISVKKRPADARDKIAAKAKLSDARQKIIRLKSQKDTVNINTNENRNKQVVSFTRKTGFDNKISLGGGQVSGNIVRTVNQNPRKFSQSQPTNMANFQIKRTVPTNINSGARITGAGGPVIQIHNEQYQSRPYHPAPVTFSQTPVMAPVDTSHNYPEEEDVYVEEYEEEEYVEDFDDRQWAQEPNFYAAEKTLTIKMPQFVVKNNPVKNVSSSFAFADRVSSETASQQPSTLTTLKRKAINTAPPRTMKPVTGPGPVRVGGGANGVRPAMKSAPAASGVSAPKKTKLVKPKAPPEEETEGDAAILSPLQGFRILVSNLHSIVTQDDIIELFGAIGPMKRARLVKQGMAEVVYVQKDDALKAVQKYNNRELDGQSMQVKLLTNAKAQVKPPPEIPVEIASPAQTTQKGGPLRLGQNEPKKSDDGDVDLGTIHRALFKTGGSVSNKPVTFTVKI